MQITFPPRGRQCVVICLVSGLMSGCAVVKPYVYTADTSPLTTYQSVEQEARRVSAEYADKIQDLEYYDVGTAVLGVGAVFAGALFAVFDAHNDTILASASVGAGAAGSRAFLPIGPRKDIYGNGQDAIACAITATSFAHKTDSQGNATPASSAISQKGALKGALNGTKGKLQSAVTSLTTNTQQTSGGRLMAVLAARKGGRLLEAVQDANNASQTALDLLDASNTNSAGRLKSTLDAIVAAVNKQLRAARVDPEAAEKAVSDNMGAYVTKIREAAKKAKDALEDVKEKAEDLKETAAETTMAANQMDKEAQNMKAANLNKQAADLENSAQDLGRDARTLDAAAGDAEGDAKQAESVIQTILEITEVPITCMGGLS